MFDVTSHRLKWSHLVRAEPLLADLERDCLEMATRPTHCATASWYGHTGRPGAKRRMMHLVGWCRRSPEWHTPLPAGRLYSGGELLRHRADEQPGRVAILAEDIAHGRDFLWSSEAYDIVYQHLLKAIGDCADGGRCGCWA